jgi:hypothetical protein
MAALWAAKTAEWAARTAAWAVREGQDRSEEDWNGSWEGLGHSGGDWDEV